MNSSSVIKAIVSGEFSNNEINDIIIAIKEYRRLKSAKAKSELEVGDCVKWDSRRMGEVATGVIVKVCRKNVHVRTTIGQVWSVPASSLSKV
jgi:putative ribosome biogenesis GTPase RsgA